MESLATRNKRILIVVYNNIQVLMSRYNFNKIVGKANENVAIK